MNYKVKVKQEGIALIETSMEAKSTAEAVGVAQSLIRHFKFGKTLVEVDLNKLEYVVE